MLMDAFDLIALLDALPRAALAGDPAGVSAAPAGRAWSAYAVIAEGGAG